MASRLRNGLRTPSLTTLSAIVIEFEISDEKVAQLWESVRLANGDPRAEAAAFGRWFQGIFDSEPIAA